MSDQHSSEVEYRSIPGFPAYRVGSDGSLWSRHKRQQKTGTWNGEWKLQRPGKCGSRLEHRFATLHHDGQKRIVLIHRLVLELFVGPCPDGLESCHENGIGSDNRVSNLRWDTHERNMADQVRHGTARRGESHGRAKVTEEDVQEMKRLRQEGWTYKQLGERFDLHLSNARRAVLGETWSEV